jgi:hypothetical protein
MRNNNRFVLLALAATLLAAPACASRGYVYRGGVSERSGYLRNIERIAQQNGYRDGRDAGERDARRGRSFSFNRHDDWRDADGGYRREYGDRDFYRHEFREGFRSGYRSGYNSYARDYRR